MDDVIGWQAQQAQLEAEQQRAEKQALFEQQRVAEETQDRKKQETLTDLYGKRMDLRRYLSEDIPSQRASLERRKEQNRESLVELEAVIAKQEEEDQSKQKLQEFSQSRVKRYQYIAAASVAVSSVGVLLHLLPIAIVGNAFLFSIALCLEIVYRSRKHSCEKEIASLVREKELLAGDWGRLERLVLGDLEPVAASLQRSKHIKHQISEQLHEQTRKEEQLRIQLAQLQEKIDEIERQMPESTGTRIFAEQRQAELRRQLDQAIDAVVPPYPQPGEQQQDMYLDLPSPRSSVGRRSPASPVSDDYALSDPRAARAAQFAKLPLSEEMRPFDNESPRRTT